MQRMARHEKHPVYDFLFEYYSFRPAHLLRWTPGLMWSPAGATRDDIAWSEFVACDGALTLHASRIPRASRFIFLGAGRSITSARC